MKIYIKIYSIFKNNIKIKIKIKIKFIVFIIIKKRINKYFFLKKTLFFKNNIKIIILFHVCNILNFNHSIKHLMKINHNSILEKKINDLF